MKIIENYTDLNQEYHKSVVAIGNFDGIHNGHKALIRKVIQLANQSSRMAGASWLTTLRRITIPLLKPGIFAGWILLFVIFLRELSISIILYSVGTETLSVGVLYLADFEGDPLTAALAIVQTIILLGCIVLFRKVAGKEALTA